MVFHRHGPFIMCLAFVNRVYQIAQRCPPAGRKGTAEIPSAGNGNPFTRVKAFARMSECALRVVTVWTLSIPEVLAKSPFVFNGITIGLIAWSIAYGRRQRQRGTEAKAKAAAAS
jgi:hypothetical protein